MSARSDIVKALVAAFKQIDGSSPYLSNIFGNCVPKHVFWDEVSDFPYMCVVDGSEQREYLPGGFKWGYLGISIKIYVKDEESSLKLQDLMSDVEKVLDNSTRLVYGTGEGQQTAEIRVTSLVTDEGLLAPYGIGEININVQYQVV